MADKVGKPKVKKPETFKVKFIQPFTGSFQAGNTKQYHFKITSRNIWPKGKRGPKTPVEMELDNEVVYEWLKKFEEVVA